MANLQIYSINQMLSEQHSQLTHLVNQTNSTKKSSIASLHIKSIKQKLSEQQYSQPTYLIHQKVIRRTAKQVYTSSLSNKSCQKNNKSVYISSPSNKSCQKNSIASLHSQSIKQKLSKQQHSQPTHLVHQTKVVRRAVYPICTSSLLRNINQNRKIFNKEYM